MSILDTDDHSPNYLRLFCCATTQPLHGGFIHTVQFHSELILKPTETSSIGGRSQTLDCGKLRQHGERQIVAVDLKIEVFVLICFSAVS